MGLRPLDLAGLSEVEGPPQSTIMSDDGRGAAGWERGFRYMQGFRLMLIGERYILYQLFTESVLDEILLSMRTEDKQRAREILQEMDLLPYEDCHPMGLSGGQNGITFLNLPVF